MNIGDIARICHEANRAIQHATGDPNPSPSWDEAPQDQRTSAIHGVKAALDGATPEELHQSWLEEKHATGWVWGETKDAEAKTHPCMVIYSALPENQRIKDHVFGGIVHAVAELSDAQTEAPSPTMKLTPVQVPTVGRIVHYYGPNGRVPYAAIVTHINPKGDPHLTVFETWGETSNVGAVRYSAEPKEGHWTWPPRV